MITSKQSRTGTPYRTPVAERIVQRRTQMFVHSYLYYVLDQPIVSDSTWQAWANELRLLQRNHPNLVVNFYDTDFADWDGATGMHLPQYPWVVDRGHHLLRLHEALEQRSAIPVRSIESIFEATADTAAAPLEQDVDQAPDERSQMALF
jgi:hypothetical protein